jgi:transposase
VAGQRQGRQTPAGSAQDKLDAVWLAKVAERQMIRPSFEPPPQIRQLRDLTRYWVDLVEARSAEKQRVEKLLEDAHIKLSVVASDIFGVSGREMMAALIGGQTNPKALAQLARGRMRAKLSELEEAFTGFFTDHHGFQLTKMLGRVDTLDTDITVLETKIEEMIAPFARAVASLDEIPGIGTTGAHVIIAEIGLDMTRFPTPAHLGSFRSRSQGVRGPQEGQRQHRARQPLPGPGPRGSHRERRPDRHVPR